MTYLDARRRALGERRAEEHMAKLAYLQGMLNFSLIGIGYAKDQGYSDEFLDAVQADADDIVEAAENYCAFIYELTEHWRAQRQEAE